MKQGRSLEMESVVFPWTLVECNLLSSMLLLNYSTGAGQLEMVVGGHWVSQTIMELAVFTEIQFSRYSLNCCRLCVHFQNPGKG